MKNKIVFFAALAAAAVILAQDQTSVPSRGPAPLVRGDRVTFAPRVFTPPKRDLFTIQTYVSAAGTGPAAAGPGYVTAPPAKETAEEDKPEEAPKPVFVLRYVGFVQNRARTKFVGLVMFEGRPLSVETNDVIGPGWKVRRLSEKEIEVEGPDGTTQVFALEGELR